MTRFSTGSSKEDGSLAPLPEHIDLDNDSQYVSRPCLRPGSDTDTLINRKKEHHDQTFLFDAISTPPEIGADIACTTPEELDCKLMMSEACTAGEYESVESYRKHVLGVPCLPRECTNPSELALESRHDSCEDECEECSSDESWKACAEFRTLVNDGLPSDLVSTVRCLIENIPDEVVVDEISHVSHSGLLSQALNHDRFGCEWEVPSEETKPPRVQKPKISDQNVDKQATSSCWSRRVFTPLLALTDAPSQSSRLKSRNHIAGATRAVHPKLSFLSSNGHDIDTLASEVLDDVDTGVSDVAEAVCIVAQSKSEIFDNKGTNIESLAKANLQLTVLDDTFSLMSEQTDVPVIACASSYSALSEIDLLLKESPSQQSWQEGDVQDDDSPAHLLLPCQRVRACKPPISRPGPGPATQTCGEKNRGIQKHTRSPPTHKVSWGTVGTLIEVADEPQDVFLHVYNFNSITGSLGLGIFHVGVEVYGCEVWYGASGVRKCLPKSLDPDSYVRTVSVGQTRLSLEQVCSLVADLEGKWPGESYRLMDSNCQTFAHQFCKALGLEDSLPHEYVRHGDVADWALRSFVSAIRPNSPTFAPEPIRKSRTRSVTAFLSCTTEDGITKKEEYYAPRLFEI